MGGKPKRARLNILQRAARAKRIFDRLREGWAHDEIARERLIAKLNAMAAAIADQREDPSGPAEQPASPEEATEKKFSAPSAISH